MSIFPTQYSTLSSSALKDRIEATYGFIGLQCRLLLHGVSDTYILEDQSPRFIFKIYRDSHRKLDEIKGELELLNLLKDGGAKVSYPIKAIDGNLIQSFNAAEGTRYGVLFSYAEGEAIMAPDNAQLKTIGREMAAVHNITAGLELNYPRKSYNISTTLTGPLAVLEPAFKDLEEEYAYLSQTVADVTTKLGQLNLEEFSHGYCHYDFLPKNFHFAANGELTFFDFDFAGKGYLVNDIASFYIHYFLEFYANKITQAEADRSFNVFIESYREVRPLTDDELKAIPYFGFGFWVFYLGFQYENFDDWSSIFFGASFLRSRIALLKKWMEIPIKN
jgi:Ser/Thr protein kinase RdoA (MazF antagonist)